MATRFEIALHGENPVALRAAGEEALEEIDRLEAQLSLYRPGSELARLNREAHERPVRVTPGLFRLLTRALELSRATHGAFDITVAPLVRCWGFMGGTGTGVVPAAEALADARAKVGSEHIALDAGRLTVQFTRAGVMLDLGAIGKGHAVDRAAAVLRAAGVGSALIHGGTSTSMALGRQPDGTTWKVAVISPNQDSSAKPLTVVELENESLSVSAVWGRSFRIGDKTYGHIIDPRTGAPTEGARLTAVVLPNATETDALSTALLTAPELMDEMVKQHPQLRCLVVSGSEGSPQVTAHEMPLL
jgi:thiamine biosynthesis lipoprotein